MDKKEIALGLLKCLIAPVPFNESEVDKQSITDLVGLYCKILNELDIKLKDI